MLDPHPFTLFVNPHAGTPGLVVLPEAGFRRARAAIAAWPGYVPTPLRDLTTIAADARLGVLRLKDEAERFGLGSFKALGGAYAVAVVVAGELARRGVATAVDQAALMAGRWRDATGAITVTCAMAWGAQRCHCRAVIFVHEGVSEGRAAAITAYGAEVRRVAGTYDDSVRVASEVAAAEGWFVVSDTSWEGYTEVPRAIMQGYRVMADEAVAQWQGAPPTHVFIQGGVGGVAAAVSVQMRAAFAPVPRPGPMPAPMIVVVEPDRAACLLVSAELGERTSVAGDLDTLMAGLACGEPSLLAWQELDRGAGAFMSIPDEAAVAVMRLLAGVGVVAGESGVAGLAGCLLAAGDVAARAALGLGEASRVLVFSTEGATDAALYARLVG